MKTLTLNQTWTLCLRMWRWVSKQPGSVSENKERWLNKNGFRNKSEVTGNCFFCEYAIQHYPNYFGCSGCPGKLVDEVFKCIDPAYHYAEKPKEFYQELLRLNRIRKLKKSKTKKKKGVKK